MSDTAPKNTSLIEKLQKMFRGPTAEEAQALADKITLYRKTC